jgi:hypothetical protein
MESSEELWVRRSPRLNVRVVIMGGFARGYSCKGSRGSRTKGVDSLRTLQFMSIDNQNTFCITTYPCSRPAPAQNSGPHRGY